MCRIIRRLELVVFSNFSEDIAIVGLPARSRTQRAWRCAAGMRSPTPEDIEFACPERVDAKCWQPAASVAPKAEAGATGAGSIHADATVLEVALEFGFGFECAVANDLTGRGGVILRRR